LHFWVASTESLTIPMAGLSAFRRNGEVMLNSTRRCYPSALALVTLALSSPPREEATGAKIRPGNPAPAIGPGINRRVETKRVNDPPVSAETRNAARSPSMGRWYDRGAKLDPVVLRSSTDR